MLYSFANTPLKAAHAPLEMASASHADLVFGTDMVAPLFAIVGVRVRLKAMLRLTAGLIGIKIGLAICKVRMRYVPSLVGRHGVAARSC